jgi:hypothetical protein
MDDAITVFAELPGAAASSHAGGNVSGRNWGRRIGVARFATQQPQTAQGGLDPIADGLPWIVLPRQAIPPRNMLMMIDCAITRTGKGVLGARARRVRGG